MATNLVLSGGPLHDFASTTAALVGVLNEEGIASTTFDDPRAALAALAEAPAAWDLVTVNGLHAELRADRHAHLRDRWSFALTDAQARTIHQHVVAGGGLLACHTAVICFDAHPSWAECIGASWTWDRSSHPPLGRATIRATAEGRTHPLTAGVDDFTTTDEVYGFLDLAPDLVPLLTSTHGGSDHPVLWARTVGEGRVVTDLLGHDAAAVLQPDHRKILRRAAAWLTAADRSDATP